MPVICGDCKEVIKRMDENSVDSIVTDPPAGIAFMNKEWDKNKGGRDQWIEWMTGIATECLRVIKPGGHALVWSLPRTSHWTATAWEDGGFEVRDKVVHVFGCLSEDTEILTINGWERYHRNIYKDIILTYNIHDETFAFDKPTREFIYKNEYPAYRIYSDYTDQIVSRNHRCIVERDGRDVFCYSETLKCQEKIPILESLHDLPETIPNIHEGTSITKQILFERMFENREETKKEIADGRTQNDAYNVSMWKKEVGGNVSSEVYKNTNVQPPLQSGLYNSSNIDIQQIRQDGDEISGNWFKRAVEPSMERWGNIFQNTWKLLWGEICEMPGRIFINVEKRWLCNGTPIDNGKIIRTMPCSIRSCSSYRSRSDQQCTGESSTIQKQPRTQKIRRELSKVEEIKYDGNMWCVSVPSGAFVARRNGKIFITGNSGFPKSLDISKQLDKVAGVEREVIGEIVRGDVQAAKENGKGYLADPANKNNVKQFGYGIEKITMPATNAAKQFSGFGTALKPAHEDWILLRKPVEGTIAQNVLEYGVGGINIDGCRIGETGARNNGNSHGTIGSNSMGVYGKAIKQDYNKGRFPANLIHDGSNEVLALFPQTNGANKNYSGYENKFDNAMFNLGDKSKERTRVVGDSGSAARFFYCAKPSKSERNIGCENLPHKTAGECTDRVEGSDGLNSPRAGAGRTNGSKNDHPTVKSISLMRYLCKLITPPNGIVLDPFCGSGSTGLAAYLEGFQCIMIDSDPHSCEIAEARMKGIIKENSKLS